MAVDKIYFEFILGVFCFPDGHHTLLRLDLFINSKICIFFFFGELLTNLKRIALCHQCLIAWMENLCIF